MKYSYITWFVLLLVLVYRLSHLDDSYINTVIDTAKVVKIDNVQINAKWAYSWLDKLNKLRENIYLYYMTYYPSPYSELLLGTVVGNDALKLVPITKQELVVTGTIHVVVVSGYNMALVYTYVSTIVGKPYKKSSMIITILIMTLYAIFTGLQPPILRALTMTTVLIISKYYGRKISTNSVIIFTGIVLTIINPQICLSKSFILSMLATLSISMYTPIYEYIVKYINKNISGAPLLGDLTASLASLTLVWPYLSYNFGRVSILSPLFNMFLLWTIPIITVLGMAFTVILIFQVTLLIKVASFVIYPFLFAFINGARFFSKFEITYINYKMSVEVLVVYYILVFAIYFYFSKRVFKDSKNKHPLILGGER